MKYFILLLAGLSFALNSCKHDTSSKSTHQNKIAQKFENKGHELVYNMTQVVGGYNKLLEKKNVQYTYTYKTPDGKNDISTEKYIFEGELSYGNYKKHDRTLPNLSGALEQGFDGEEYWLKHNNQILTDPDLLKRVAFNRPTNYYWFTMMQKLLDPGLEYEYLGEELLDEKIYDIVKVSFNSPDDKPTDIYQLYINKNTSLVDQFLFTVADFGKMDTPFLMQLQYEEIDGFKIPSKRQYKKSTWNAEVNDQAWTHVNWTNIKFNVDLIKKDFKKENKMRTEERTTLKSKLDEKKANFELKADKSKKKDYKEGIDSVTNSGILSRAKDVGDTAPNFELTNAIGESVELSDYLKKGQVVLTWYRGGWCPYCNLTLRELQHELPNFKLNGANLIALTPELPDKSISTTEKNDLEFEVLSDLGNKVAREYGIVFKLTDKVAERYNAGFNMNDYNGDDSNELPLAATYIINQDGKITYAFLDADYRNRAEPTTITEELMKN